jgi:hypothetical protein
MKPCAVRCDRDVGRCALQDHARIGAIRVRTFYQHLQFYHASPCMKELLSASIYGRMLYKVKCYLQTSCILLLPQLSVRLPAASRWPPMVRANAQILFGCDTTAWTQKSSRVLRFCVYCGYCVKTVSSYDLAWSIFRLQFVYVWFSCWIKYIPYANAIHASSVRRVFSMYCIVRISKWELSTHASDFWGHIRNADERYGASL